MGKGDQRWRFPITMSLTILGVIFLVAAVIALFVDGAKAQYVAAGVFGLALVAYFAPQAAGARRTKMGADRVKAETQYDTPPLPSNQQRRIYIPKGFRRK